MPVSEIAVLSLSLNLSGQLRRNESYFLVYGPIRATNCVCGWQILSGIQNELFACCMSTGDRMELDCVK